jgi:hypothetical protein
MNPEAWEQLLKVVEILIIPFGLYMVRVLTMIQKEVSDLKTVLIGIDGKNGIRSRVIRMERRVEKLALAQAHRHGEETDEEDDEDV